MAIVSFRRSSRLGGFVLGSIALFTLGCDFRAAQSFSNGQDAGAPGGSGATKLGAGGNSSKGSGSANG